MTYIPHGTGAGEIGNGANINTDVTPGSDGGRFIGFGEDGTSAIANRAHWFLSQNIDHVYQEVHRDIAVNKRYDRTAGASETSYQFAAGEEIWTGDSTYPGSAGTSDAEGMQMLFNIVDANYNELTDGEDNEVRVKSVFESTGVTDIYQGEFQSEPIIYFQTVNPTTGAVVDANYTIPNSTAYKILCGVKTNVAEMPADALIRFKVQSSSEAEAGMFLQDGSRPMTGTLDLDDQGMTDENLTGALSLSESGQTELYQPTDAAVYPSLVGAVNSNTEMNGFLQGDRCMNRAGTFTTGSAPNLTYPALTVSLNGQILHFASDTVTASSGNGQYYLFVAADGTLTFAQYGGWSLVPAGSIPIWTAELDTNWVGPLDLRWAGTPGKHAPIYVGSGVGADFASLDDLIPYLLVVFPDPDDSNTNREIVIVGEAAVTETFTVYKGWTLRGASAGDSDVTSRSLISANLTNVSSHVISAEKHATIKELTISWDATTDQGAGYAGLSIAEGCRVENVRFENDATEDEYYDANIKAVNGAAMSGPVIKGCYFDKFAYAGITAQGENDIHIETCTFLSNGSPAAHINLFPTNSATATSRTSTIRDCYFIDSPSNANIRVGGPNVLIDSCYADLDATASSPFVDISQGGVSQLRAGAIIRNCLIEGAYQVVFSAINDADVVLSLTVENCSCKAATEAICDLRGQASPASHIAFRNNTFEGDGTNSEIAILTRIGGVHITDNTFKGWTLYAVHVDSKNGVVDADGVWITGNHIDDCATKTVTCTTPSGLTNVQATAIFLEGDAQYSVRRVTIADNVFNSIGGSAIRATYSEDVKISGNTFYEATGVYLLGGGGTADMTLCAVIFAQNSGMWRLANNRFDQGGYAANDDYDDVDIDNGYIRVTQMSGPIHINDNYFGDSKGSADTNWSTGFIDDSWHDVSLGGGTYDTTIANNYFYRDLTGGTDQPSHEFAHIYAVPTGSLTLSGCTFVTKGGDISRSNMTVYQVYVDTTRLIMTGCCADCLVKGFSNLYIWDADTAGNGSIAIGCVFYFGNFTSDKSVRLFADSGVRDDCVAGALTLHKVSGSSAFELPSVNQHDIYSL